ncbi:uncharacterized protein N7529_001047 [Penicillium soppii]|uniref:uncharacterized protein n=1 Tax=Penicillium soppii TaxID=69789 RepID=UPI0025476F9D|nr:uncharacterized protein N7529_001047 [Penicillium soppii]KAJ5882375.1 hypothetical protein N7529_001047 [Penicillium soppii]
MDPTFKLTVIAKFAEERDSFFDELEALSTGDTQGRKIAAIKADLLHMSNTLSMWKFVPDNSDAAFGCFPGKCENLAAIIPEVADRMAGCLTLRFPAEEKLKVQVEAQRREYQQLEWESRAPEDDNENQSVLRSLWNRLYIINDECDCRQCFGEHVRTL